MPAKPKAPAPGTDYIYQPAHGNGYGQNARGEVLTAEMTELDLKPGTPVTVHEIDPEGWVIVDWVDDVSIGRLTAVEPVEFDADFTPA